MRRPGRHAVEKRNGLNEAEIVSGRRYGAGNEAAPTGSTQATLLRGDASDALPEDDASVAAAVTADAAGAAIGAAATGTGRIACARELTATARGSLS